MFIQYPPEGARMCDICINTTDNPSIQFRMHNDRFLCNECIEFLTTPPDRTALRQQWLDIMATRRKEGDYDFILAYSGGADSTAALKLLRKEYKLKVLAFTINNGMKTERIWQNASTVARYLGADWLYIHDVNRAAGAITQEFRVGGHVCGSVCEEGWKIPNYIKMMKTFQTDHVLTGLEIPTKGSITSSRYPFMVKFMAAHLMTKKEVFEFISDLPWENPNIKQGFDTDCLGAGFGLELYRVRHRRHAPIVIEFLSPRIRYGLLDREEELAKLNVPVPEKDWMFLERRFGNIRAEAASNIAGA